MVSKRFPETSAEQLLVSVFTIVPMLALIAAVPLAWAVGATYPQLAHIGPPGRVAGRPDRPAAGV